MKRFIAAAVTASALLAFLGMRVLRSTPSSAETPEQCLEQMFLAMKDGNVSAFLACFTGELRERLDRDAKVQGTQKFAEYMKETVAPVKGRAIYRSESADPEQAKVVVDRVFEGRPWEYQCYRLRRASGQWRIFALDPVELHDPPIPYGTPAYPGDDFSQESAKSARPRE